MALQLQLAYILSRTDIWQSHTVLRVVAIVESEADADAEAERLDGLVTKFRYDVDVRIMALRTARGYGRPLLAEAERRHAEGTWRPDGCVVWTSPVALFVSSQSDGELMICFVIVVCDVSWQVRLLILRRTHRC